MTTNPLPDREKIRDGRPVNHKEKIRKIADHMIERKAFTLRNTEGVKGSWAKLRHISFKSVERWQNSQVDLQHWRVKTSRKQLITQRDAEAAERRKGKATKQREVEVREEEDEYDDDMITEANGENESVNNSGDEEGHEHNGPSLAEERSFEGFTRLMSDGRPLRITDSQGSTLGYKVKMSMRSIEALEKADECLEDSCLFSTAGLAHGKRGNFHSAHLGSWADSSRSVFPTKQWRQLNEDEGKGWQWKKEAAPALRELSNLCRHVSPEGFAKCSNVDFRYNKDWELESDAVPIANMWFTLAINRNQTSNGARHYDWKDCDSVPNGVIPYGSFKGGFLVLWSLGMMVEVARGEAFIFFGSFIAHSVVEIEGRRNVIDCFAHKSIFDWWEGINRRGLTTLRKGSTTHPRDDTHVALSRYSLRPPQPSISNGDDLALLSEQAIIDITKEMMNRKEGGPILSKPAQDKRRKVLKEQTLQRKERALRRLLKKKGTIHQ